MKTNLIVHTLLISMLVLAGCQNKTSNLRERNMDFNENWKFLNEEIHGAEQPGFDDSGWEERDLPHDWSIEDYDVQDSVHIGPFFKHMENGDDVGYLRGGTGWYRKSFVVASNHKDKQIYLHFDGVQTEMTLWVNGNEAGKHVYGYTPFYFNITPYLNEPGKENVLAVKVINPGQNSRWFAGAGIYRDVTISYLDPVHIDIWGLGVSTPAVTDDKAEISMNVSIRNHLEKGSQVDIKAEILSPGGTTLTEISKQENLETGRNNPVMMHTEISNPALWDIDNPQLHKVIITLSRDGKAVDRYETTFGIRTIAFSAEKGFLLNRRNVLLKGACMHHDNGLLGAAAFRRAEERRVEIMKKNGYNAIRTSHNPPSKHFLNACDKLGVLVINESFDMWMQPKRPNDYHRFYEEWWDKDTRAMVLRDRNHPSIIMWSVGNEVKERADSSGIAIASAAASLIKSIDNTRPVTQAICGFWDNPGKVWDESAPAFAVVDIGGYNYQRENYEKDHEKHPDRVMYGSESIAKEAFEYWNDVTSHTYVIGDFVWTGMDYIGESGIGHAVYKDAPDAKSTFLMPWPWYISWCGDIDITGNKKPQKYYRDVVWGESKLEMAVHEPVPDGKHEIVSFWGWPNEYQSWNWKGQEGNLLKVSVYSSYPRVRLERNGSVIGEKEIKPESRLTAVFEVPYEPGELKAIGLVNNVVEETKSFNTAGEPAKLLLMAERTEIQADRNEIVYVNVAIADEAGNIIPLSNANVSASVKGAGELISAGNAAPRAEGSIQDSNFSLYNGRGLIIIRSNGEPGEIKVEVNTAELASAGISIAAVK